MLAVAFTSCNQGILEIQDVHLVRNDGDFIKDYYKPRYERLNGFEPSTSNIDKTLAALLRGTVVNYGEFSDTNFAMIPLKCEANFNIGDYGIVFVTQPDEGSMQIEDQCLYNFELGYKRYIECYHKFPVDEHSELLDYGKFCASFHISDFLPHSIEIGDFNMFVVPVKIV